MLLCCGVDGAQAFNLALQVGAVCTQRRHVEQLRGYGHMDIAAKEHAALPASKRAVAVRSRWKKRRKKEGEKKEKERERKKEKKGGGEGVKKGKRD